MLRPALVVAALALACADAPPALAPPDASLDAPRLPDAPARPPPPDVAPLPDAAPHAHGPVQFGGPADDELRALAVAPSGELTVAVTFRESISVGAMLHRSAGGSDVLLARLSPDGDIRWTLRLGGAGDERAAGLALDATTGELTVALDVSGRADLAGAVVESAGGVDVAVARFTPDGRLRHVARLGGPGDDHAAGVAALADGAIVAATFEETATVAASSLVSAGGRDVALVAFTAAGALRWARRLGGAGDDAARAVAVGNLGDVYAAGSFEGLADYGGALLTSDGGADVFVASLTAAGANRWSRRFGGRGDDRAEGLAARDDLALTGSFEGLADFGGALLTSAGGRDGFVVALSREGAHRWSRRVGGAGDDRGLAASIDAEGAVTVAGEARGRCDLGGVLHEGRGGADAFVARYAAGALRAETSWGGAGDDGATALGGGAWVAVGFAGEAGVGGSLVRAVGGRDVLLARAP